VVFVVVNFIASFFNIANALAWLRFGRVRVLIRYGVLAMTADPYGVTACAQYGRSYLVLKNARMRSTFADKDTLGTTSTLATMEYYCHVLATCVHTLLFHQSAANSQRHSRSEESCRLFRWGV
jgi:hypothetical protein